MTLSGREQLVDIGRVCVASAHRDSTHRVFQGVLGQILCEMRRLGCQEAATVVTGPVARVCERWGMRVSVLGPPAWVFDPIRLHALGIDDQGAQLPRVILFSIVA